MRVRDLIDHLQGCDPDSEVMFVYNYGDHWKTMVASEINETIEFGLVEYSEYHRMYKMVDMETLDEEDAEFAEAQEEDPDVTREQFFGLQDRKEVVLIS